MKARKLELCQLQDQLSLDDILGPNEIQRIMGGDDSTGSSDDGSDTIYNVINDLLNSPDGGVWTSSTGTVYDFTSQDVQAIDSYINGLTSNTMTDSATGEQFCSFNTGIPLSMTAQSGQDCVPYTLGYIASCFGQNASQAVSNFASALANAGLAADLDNVGTTVSNQQMNTFLSQYFNTSALSSVGGIVGALNAGDCIYAEVATGNYDSNGNMLYHAITVIGYSVNPDNSADFVDVRYMDPATGRLATMPFSQFNSSSTYYAVAISGVH
jgi:hypothetical protein